MNNLFDFSTFSRQSTKGILVIYIAHLYKFLKVTWILVFLIVKDFTKITSKVDAIYIYAGIAFFLIFFLIRTYLIFKNFQFKIENEHFILKQGILKKTNTAIPFHRIQNINFKQNIVQQIIGVFEVSIETAGSSTTEISIKALSLQKATALKEIIANNTKFQEEKVEKVEQQSEPLLRIGVKELFKVSLTENHLRNLLLFFAIVFGILQQLQQIIDSLGQTEALDSFIEENTNAVSASIFLVIIFLLLLTSVALVTSFVRVFLVHFNLTVFLKEDAFEINQGLFTKKSIILKRQKIQNITISTNPLKRLIGISFITFKQAVSGKLSKKQMDKIIKIVGCKEVQINKVKNILSFNDNLEEISFENSNRYLKYRNYFRSLFFFLPINILFYFGMEEYNAFWINLLILPIYLLAVHVFYKKRIFKYSDDILIIGSGVLETNITYLPFYKVQNIKLKQTIFQERKKVADLVFQTASGKLKIPCLDFEKALYIYNYTIFKVESSTKPWM